MNLKPLGEHVIVKPSEHEEKTKGGVYLPDTADKDKPFQGEVMAVGQGKLTEEGKRLPMEVKKGDKVIFSKYAGTEVKLEGEKYLILKEDDILAIH
ncbi:MAG: co-chaperone GroES [Candidatus Riflebacteria bacterium]|nr:co-chaperone GroES [Candidatus Riflebacteria bacterium]